jgi:hypothetical protein
MAAPPPSNMTAPVLEYAPKIAFDWFRAIRRWGARLIVLIVSLWAASFIPSLWHSGRLYYFQQQCIAHPIAPGVLVVSTGPPLITTASSQFNASRTAFRFTDEIQVYSAVEDPRDPSRFTLEFNVDFVHGTEDCTLQPDGSIRVTSQRSENADYFQHGTRSANDTLIPFAPEVFDSGRTN